jgi:hypothetical protein
LTCIVPASRPRAKIRLPARTAGADKEDGMMVFIAMVVMIVVAAAAAAVGRGAGHA